MPQNITVVDAFTEQLFQGNPAAVCGRAHTREGQSACQALTVVALPSKLRVEEQMRKVTSRVSMCFGTAAVLVCATCSTRSPLLGSGGSTGSGAVASGGNRGPGGSWDGDGIAPLGGSGGAPGGAYGSGGLTASGGEGITALSGGGRNNASGGFRGMGAYYGGDGIAPFGGGGSFFGGGGYPSGGRGGTGGVDLNCFMRCGQGNAIYYSSGGAGGSRDALPAGSNSDANDCETKRQLYYAAVAAAGQCDPAAALPCFAYDGVECPTVGVSPDSVAALTANLSEFKAAGCSLPLHSCPIWVMTPPPYTCQAGADGVHRCYSVCEQMIGGRATCVGQSTGCANVVLAAGFCSGTSMLCCSPY